MKKFYISLLALAMVLAAVPSCEKDLEEPHEPTTEQPGDNNENGQNPEDEKPGEDNKEPEPEPEPVPVITYAVTASLEGVADGLVSWSEGDTVTAWSVAADGSYGYEGYSERDIVAASIDGTSATFNFTSLPQGGRTWLAYMSNSGYDGCSAKKVEFNYRSSYTQTEAGVPGKDMVKLLGTEIIVGEYEPKADTVVALETQMKLAGALLQNVVVSASYADEKVVSVQLVSKENMIAGLDNAAMAYNLLEDGKFWLDNNGSLFGEECALIWDNTSQSIITTVTNPAAISEGKAVFMPVAPVQVGAYKYVITTDIAIYTLDYPSEDLIFADGEVRKVVIDLDSENVVKRLEIASIKGDLMYTGDIPETVNVGHKGGTSGIGYWYARSKDKDSEDWTTRENKDGNEGFYSNVKFVITDDATGAVADWATVTYRSGDTWWDYTVQPNTVTEPRSATVTAYFDDADGYLIGEEYMTKTTKIVQEAYNDIKKISFWGGIDDIDIEAAGGKTGWSWWVMQVDGVNMETWSDETTQSLYKAGKFVCYDYAGDVKGDVVDWLTVAYRTDADGRVSDTWWDIVAVENTADVERKALVEFTMPAMEGYTYADGDVYVKAAVVRQKANVDVAASFETLLFDHITNAGLSSVAAAKLSLTIGGAPVADVAAALTQYDVKLEATGGAKVDAVAADGTVTMTFPANNPARERTYELNVTFNGDVKATASFVQEAGTSEAAAFTYEFGAWQSKGQYTVQFNAVQLDFKHWLAVFNDLKYNGETPASLTADDEKALVMQLLGLNVEQYAAQPFIFTVEFGGVGESKVLISLKEANTTGEMIVYNGTVYDAYGAPYTTYTVNHLAN